MAEGETTRVVLEALKAWIEKYGIPLAFYVDLKNVYISPKELSHFQRACDKLGIRIIKAYYPSGFKWQILRLIIVIIRHMYNIVFIVSNDKISLDSPVHHYDIFLWEKYLYIKKLLKVKKLITTTIIPNKGSSSPPKSTMMIKIN